MLRRTHGFISVDDMIRFKHSAMIKVTELTEVTFPY